MALFIVQHGLSLPKQTDPRKGLSPQGFKDVERIAQVAAGYGVSVAKICHSGKQRAEQTALIFLKYLAPDVGAQAIEGINPLDDVITFGKQLDIRKNQMIVGHLPFLEQLIAYLVSGQTEKPVIRLQNGGLVCLDFYENTQNVVIKWAINPNIP